MDFTEVANMAHTELQKPKAIIGLRTTRDLRGRGRRKPLNKPRLVCRVAADGTIRARSHYDQMAEAVQRLSDLANGGNEYAIGVLNRMRGCLELE